MSERTTVVAIPGDGIGPEIWAAARPVIDAAVAKASGGDRGVDFDERPAGQVGIDVAGAPLPRETLDAIERHRLAIKGPLTTPIGTGFRSINVALRIHFDLYASIREIRCLPGVATPVRRPELVDVVLFRENTEDVYMGFELEPGTPEALALGAFCRERFGWPLPADAGIGLKPISASASKRLVRAALRYAVAHGRRSVTLVHKGNIQKFTEGRFRTWAYELAAGEFADATVIEGVGPFGREPEGTQDRIVVRDLLADAFLQEILVHPERIDVVATTNLNGDYAADALAAQVGGVGVVPGGNVNEETGMAVFEATHGTAPSIAGRDEANPIAMTLSGAMLLDFIGWRDAGALVRDAVRAVVASGVGTPDLGLSTTVGTQSFGEALVEAVARA